MLNVRNYAVYAWLLCIPLLLSMQAVNASHLPEFTDLVKETSPAVVNISTCSGISLTRMKVRRVTRIQSHSVRDSSFLQTVMC